MHKNIEGYPDPTAGEAMSRVMKEYMARERRRFADRHRLKIYVASPCAGNIEGNVAAAIRYCQSVIDQGHMPIASHLLYPQMLDDNNPDEREMGLMFGLALLAVCDEVWVFGEVSAGVAREVAEAKRLKKRIRYFEEADV